MRWQAIVDGTRAISAATDTSFDWVIDPFTWQTLNAAFAKATPEDDAAVVPVVLPSRIRLVVGPAKQPVFLVHSSIVDKLANMLLEPPGPKKVRDELREGLRELVKTADKGWTETKRRLVRDTLKTVLLGAAEPQSVSRLGSGTGSGAVDGIPALTTAASVGLEQYVSQETLARARAWLDSTISADTPRMLPHGSPERKELSGEARRLQRTIKNKHTAPAERTDAWGRLRDIKAQLRAHQETGARVPEHSVVFGDDDDLRDAEIAHLARIWGLLDNRERIALCAESKPEHLSLFEEAAEQARAPLTPPQRQALEAEPTRDPAAIARLIGLTKPTAKQAVYNARISLKRKLGLL